MENDEIILSPIQEDSQETDLENSNNSEILLNSESEVDTEATTSISEEEFISFNNNVCIGFSTITIALGIVGGVVLGLCFKGIFKD